MFLFSIPLTPHEDIFWRDIKICCFDNPIGLDGSTSTCMLEIDCGGERGRVFLSPLFPMKKFDNFIVCGRFVLAG